MELKDFVALTLEQILNGVKTVQGNFTKKSGKINSEIIKESNSQHPLYFGISSIGGRDVPSFLLEFDIAINIEETSSGKTGAGIFVAPFGIGSQSVETSINKQLNRIKFVIPYSLPKRL